jgi:hypothetical protein
MFGVAQDQATGDQYQVGDVGVRVGLHLLDAGAVQSAVDDLDDPSVQERVVLGERAPRVVLPGVRVDRREIELPIEIDLDVRSREERNGGEKEERSTDREMSCRHGQESMSKAPRGGGGRR